MDRAFDHWLASEEGQRCRYVWDGIHATSADAYRQLALAFAAGRQAEKLTLSRIKLLIENTVDDSEELPELILDIVDAAILPRKD